MQTIMADELDSKRVVIELGFVEEPMRDTSLASFYFPSKIGGKPSWLNLKDIPHYDDILCSKCSSPMMFLLQFYAPHDGNDDCFHRVLFMFCCRTPSCHSKNSSTPFIVLRCQLPRVNLFYSYEPYPKNVALNIINDSYQILLDSGHATRTCNVCGCYGGKCCSKCHSVWYCCKNHQVVDWRESHKPMCGKSQLDPHADKKESFLGLQFPEMEIVTEPEPDLSTEDEDTQHNPYSSQIPSVDKIIEVKDTKDMEQLLAASSEIADKEFQNFKKRISREPSQVMRYQLGGSPLWLSKEHIANTSDIPNCFCGSPRQFEFQVLPQLLNYLKIDSLGSSIDWGTLLIYTCTANCNSGPSYHREFIWKQDYADVDVINAL